LNAQADVSDRYNDWFNRSLYGGAGGGWYWTDHLKTELEFGASTTAELYSSAPITVAGRTTYVASRQRFSTKRLIAAQQYQFFRNTWFHPHLAAGVDLTWETVKRRDEPIFFYDPVTRQSRPLQEAVNHPGKTSLVARPFASAGFKAYMTQRGFFRSDLRFGFGGGIDEVLLRFGFGVDF
jgi:hypothetical protein